MPEDALNFTQKLDHFDASSQETFNQRYYKIAKNSTTNVSALFFYIGGEAPLIGKRMLSLAPVDLAEKNNAVLFGLEHRFFGNSAPTNLTIENLKYLTIEQGLADLAHFINAMKQDYDHTVRIGVIGGSYPGALSSWFRLLYPHLADVSWASSAPVEAKNNFTEYDYHCYEAITSVGGDKCSENTRKAFQYLETEDYNEVAKKFIGNDTPPDDHATLYYMVADTIATPVQYKRSSENLTYLCDLMNKLPEKATKTEYIDVLAKVTKEILQGESIWDSDLTQYTDVSIDAPTKDGRAWTWMTCNQVGWFQTASGKLRSDSINLEYFDRVCRKLFNRGIPNDKLTNQRFGGKNARGTSTYFINGAVDPWSTMSITTEDRSINRLVKVIPNSYHCDDLYQNVTGEVLEAQQHVFNFTSNILKGRKCNHEGGYEVLGNCICKEAYAGEFCEISVPTREHFKVVTVASVVVPTFLLLIIGGIVWVCGKKEDSDFGARPALYT